MTKYVDSPLGKIVQGTLDKITELRQKYPASPNDTIEKKHADALTTVIETVLTKLNKEVLPKFDDKNADPGLFGIVTDLWGLKNLREKLITRKYALFQDISKNLPNLIKEAKKQAKDEEPIEAVLLKLLDQQKNKFFKNAVNIPGTNLDELFQEIIRDIPNINLADPKNAGAALEQAVFQYDDEKYDLAITHPMTFELAQAIAELIQAAPRELAELVPFFNPLALNVDFHNGFKGGVISTLSGGRTLLLENVPENDQPSFTYKHSTFVKEEKTEKIIAGAAIYQQYFGRVSNLFASETARASLLQELVASESENIAEAVQKQDESSKKISGHADLKGPALLAALSNDIEELNRIKSHNLELIHSYSTKSREPVSNLIIHHPQLQEQLLQYAQTLTIAYVQHNLPESLVGYSKKTGELQTIPIRSVLDEATAKGSQKLQAINVDIDRQTQELNLSKEQALTAWKQEENEKHARLISRYTDELTAHQKTYKEINRIVLSLNKGSSIEKIENDLRALTETVDRLNRLSKKVGALTLTTQESTQLAPDESRLDIDHSLQRQKNTTASGLLAELNDLSIQINQLIQQQYKLEERLKQRLENAKADAEFAKSLSSAKPEKMREILGATTVQLEELNIEHGQCVQELQTLIEEQKWTQDAVNLKELEETRDRLFADLFNIPRQHKLYYEEEENQETILSHKEPLVKLGAVVQTIMISLEGRTRLIDSLNEPEHYTQILEALEQIKNIISQTKSEKIPFEAITAYINKNLGELKGKQSALDYLVQLLDLEGSADHQHKPGYWKEYRSRQDDFFSFAPKKEEFILALANLFENIALKQAEYKEILKNSTVKEALQEQLAADSKKLHDIKLDLTSNLEEQTRIKKVELPADTSLDQLKTRLQVLDGQISENANRIENMVLARQKLENSIMALTPITEILEKIDQLNKTIDNFAANSQYFMSTEDSLFEAADEIKELHQRLVGKVEKTKTLLDAIDDSANYQENISAIENVLHASATRINRVIAEKFDEASLQNTIRANEQQLDQLEAKYNKLVEAKLSNAEEREAFPLQVSSLIEDYLKLSQALKDHRESISNLTIKFRALNDEYCNQQIALKEAAQQQVQQQAGLFGIKIIDKFTQFFQDQLKKAQVFNAEGNLESSANRIEIGVELEVIRSLLEALPDEKGFENFVKAVETCDEYHLGEKLNGLKEARKKAFESLEQNAALNKELHERIEHRSAKVQELIGKLDEYVTSRGQDYKVKDTFSSSDRQNRFDFIRQLNDELTAYQDSGDSKTVQKTIRDNISRFPGIHLQGLLNKVLSETLDLDRKVPRDYYAEKVELSADKLNDEAELILQKPENAVFAKKIRELQKQIQIMHQYGTDLVIKENDQTCGNTAIQLAEKLKDDVNRFVVANPDGLPKPEAYQQFRSDFSARVHSEDSIMSKHRASWKPIVANILIGVVTLGIALGIKLIHSQVTQQRCAFFFDSTERQGQLRNIEEAAQKMEPPSAKT